MSVFNSKVVMGLCGALLCSAVAFGQQPGAQSAAGLPNLKGVYYRAGAAWANLPYTILWPYQKNAWKWYLSVGNMDYFAEVPGQHARTQVSDQQPTFYVRGLATQMGPKLVQFGSKNDFRRVRMMNANNFEPRSPFHQAATRDVQVAQVSANVVSIRPAANLPPGEYAIVTAAGPDQQRIFLSFDFRVGQ